LECNNRVLARESGRYANLLVFHNVQAMVLLAACPADADELNDNAVDKAVKIRLRRDMFIDCRNKGRIANIRSPYIPAIPRRAAL
jgi:hypothetical protein